MALSATEEYVEAGYFADADYVGGIAEAVVGISPYVVEDYIEAGYFVPGGSFASLTATLELAIQFGEATINSTTGMSIGVVRIKQFSSTIASEFGFEHPDNGGSSPGVNVDVGFVSSATFTVESTMSVTPSKILSANANISGAFTATMNVIATMTGETLMQNVITMSTSAELIVDSSGLLEYFANLNAQADATRTVAATVNSQASVTSQPGVSYQGASEIVSTTLLQVFEPGVRPLIPIDSNLSGAFPTGAQVKFGNNSSQTLDNNLYYIEYQDTPLVPNNTDEWVFETFVYFGQLGTSADNCEIITIAPTNYSNLNGPTLRLNTDNAANTDDVLRLTTFDDNDVYKSTLGTTDLSLGSNHISVAYKPGTGIKLWLNGSLEITHSFTGDLRPITDPSVWFGWAELDTGSISHYFWLDETRILQSSTAISDAGLTFANSSQTVPTSAYVNNTSTQLLLHYEGNYIDDDSGVKLYDATINSVSSVSTDATKVVEGISNINSAFGLGCDVDRIRSDSANLSSAFASSATGFRIKTTDANLASAFNSNIAPNYIRGATSTPSVIASMSSSVGVIKQAAMIADSIASSLTAAGRVGDYFANADATTTLTSAVVVVRGGNSTLNSTTTATAAPNYTRGATSTVAAVISLDSSLVTIKDHNAVANASSGLTASVGEITQGSVNVNSVSSLSCDASRLTVEVANFGSVFGIDVVPNSIASGGSELNVITDTTALAGVAYEASVTMQGFAAIISINKILHVDQYIYSVPKETRSWSIPKETRSHVIDRELRSYSIKGT